MSLADKFFASKIGPSFDEDFSAGASSSLNIYTTIQLLASTGIIIEWPILFVLRATEDVYLRQSRNSTSAGTGDFLLFKDTYFPLLVQPYERFISLYGKTTAGSLIFTFGNQTIERGS